jgi:hypothetical protein
MSEAIVSDGTDNQPETREERQRRHALEDHAAITASFEQQVAARFARTNAAQKALDDHRQHLHDTDPLDVDTLREVLHTWPPVVNGEWQDRLCSRCDGPYDGGTQVHIVIGETSPAVDTAVCAPCVELTGSYGEALVEIRDALEGIDAAMSKAPDDRLHIIALLAENALSIISRANHEREQQRFIASALTDIEHLTEGDL